MQTPSPIKRRIQINVRISEQELKMIEHLAQGMGLRVSEYLRYMLLQQRKKARGKK